MSIPQLLVSLAWWLLVYALWCGWGTLPGAEHVHQAFFLAIAQLFIVVGKWVWDAVQSVNLAMVWGVVKNIGRGLDYVSRAAGSLIKSTAVLFARTVKLFQELWSNVLRPALLKLNDWVRRAFDTVRRVFRPVYDFLYRVRAEILRFYTKFIRPVLDIIDMLRFGLRILSKLGVDWAKALDQRLQQFETLISENFYTLMRYINRVIDVVDSVVTFDRLLKRIPLVRSLERDVLFVWRMLINSRAVTPTSGGGSQLRTLEEIKTDTEEALLTGGGRYGPVIDEASIQWRRYLNVP